MLITRTIADTRAALAQFRKGRDRIGLVPTMGALHAGHIALVSAAQAHADRVIATIFVNPSQFNDASDLAKYPRDESADLHKLRAAGVDLVFLPDATEIYPAGDETIVETTILANQLHGALRPGHFRGVTTVVARLFNITQPDIACFGEKDYQQLQIIKRMTHDLAFPIDIIAVPTQREPSGLAMSSRNARLNDADRAAAPIIHSALMAAQALPNKTIPALRDCITQTIAREPRATLKGLDIVAPYSLDVMDGPMTRPAAIMLSVAFGDVLLIDQKVITP